MRLNEQVDYIVRDIKRQSERLENYRLVEKVFASVNITEDHNIYTYTYGEKSVYVEFSPAYGDDASKDLRSLVHKIARRFHVKFTKDATEGTVNYRADFPLIVDDKEWEIRVRFSGVVPKTCTVEEIEIPLSDEEIEENRRNALESVKTTRIERKITCK